MKSHALTALLGHALLIACSASRIDSAERLRGDAWPASERQRIASVPIEPGPSCEPELPAVWSLEAILIEIGRANPTLAAAEARLAQAQAARREARASYLPELSLGLDYLATDNPAQVFALLLNQEDLTLGPAFDPTPGTTDNWRKQVRLDWSLFSPGRGEALRSSEEGEVAARLAGEAIARRLLNAGVQAWIELGASRALLAVAAGSIEVVAERLEQTRRRFAEGAALRADVLMLEVRLAAARQSAAQAGLAVRTAESALNALMGRAPDAQLELADETVAIGVELPDGLSALLARAEEDRLDLRAAAHRARLFAFQREAARAERLPVLGLFASYDVDGSEPGIDTDLGSTTLGVGLRWPFSARTPARVAQAEAEERAAREELAELALALAREVHDAHAAVASASATLALAEAAVSSAEEAYRITAAAQDSGAATVTDVLEADHAQTDARTRAVAARAALDLARARLVAATGGVR
jgi:outer membrane protein TolC